MERSELYKGKYAAAVLIDSPAGVPLVKDLKKPFLFWKLPGGRSEEGETPEVTALREIREETGVILEKSNLSLVYKEDRRDHFFYLFRVNLSFLPKLKNRGNEGEIVGLFPLSKIKTMIDFLPNHLRILQKLKLI